MNKQLILLPDLNHNKKERFSSSTFEEEDDIDVPNQQETFEYFCVSKQLSRQYLFDNKKQQPQIPKKLNIKAIIWLQTHSWTYNMDLESTLLSIALYYLYKSQIFIHKKNLQLILGTCLFLSSKMIRSPQLQMSQILSATSHKYLPQNFEEEQAKLLQLLDFNLYFQLSLMSVRGLFQKDNNFYDKLCFLAELLLLRDQSILFNRQKFNKLVKQMKTGQIYVKQNRSFGLSELMKQKNLQILTHKYNSKFEVQNFLQNFQNF